MKPTRSRTSRGGHSLIEATLTLTLFLTFLFSIYDFGWVLFYHQTLVHQARTGARYAAVNPGNLDAAKNLVLYNQTTAGTNGMLGLQSSNVTVTRLGTAGDVNDRVNVTISGYQFVFVTLGFAGTYNGKPITVSIPVEN
jgi:Flp pilus assembly protein TadG